MADKKDMQFIKHIFKQHRVPAILVLCFFAILLLIRLFSTSFAVSGGPFTPSETLDPDCVPGGTCVVDIPTSQWGDVTGGINYAGGNVGIGEPSPAGLLDVEGTNGTNFTLVDDTGAGGPYISYSTDSGSPNKGFLYIDNFDAQIGWNGASGAYLDADSGGDLTLSTSTLSFRLNNAISRFAFSGGSIYNSGNPASINLLTLDTSNSTGVTPATVSTYPFSLQLLGSDDFSIGSDATNTYMQSWSKPLVINSQGGNNVGIGTTSPSELLEVVGGNIKATDGFILHTTSTDPVSPAVGQMWLRSDL